MIHILYVIGSLRVGGAERHLSQLVTRLDRRRFAPAIMCFEKDGPLVAELEAQGIPVFELGLGSGDGSRWRLMWSMAKATLRLAMHMRRHRYAIVHTYLYWANIVGGAAARLAGVPWLLTSRRSLGLMKDARPYMQRLENWLNRWTDLVIVNSQAVEQDCNARERNLPAVQVVYNGVDLPDELPAQPSLSKEVATVGMVANLILYKGHHDLFEAVRQLRAQGYSLQLKLAGTGQDEAAIRAACRDHGLDDITIFLGSVQDVPAFLKGLDVFVLCSHQEGFSNAVLEAMASGCAIVVTDVGGNAEAIKHQECGLIVPPRSPSQLGQALKDLLDTPALRQQYGQAAHLRAKALFSLDHMISRYESIYESFATHADK